MNFYTKEEREPSFAGHCSKVCAFPHPTNGSQQMLKGGLLWLIGIPLPIILLLWFFGVF